MAGKNTTGKNQTDDYTIGRGTVLFAPLDSNGLPKDFRDLGNAPSLNMSVSEEELEHLSTRDAVKNKDKVIILSRDMDLSFSLDELNDENLSDLLSGTTANETNPAKAIVTVTPLITAGDIVPFRWYKLETATGASAFYKDFTKFTIKTTNATPVTLVKDTDYEVHPMGNMIFLLNSTAVGVAVTNTEGLTYEGTADATAKDIDVVQAFTRSTVEGALMFLEANPANNGEYTEWIWHKVRLKADGDMSLIGDEWTEMPFSGSAMENKAASPNSPVLDIRTLKV